MLYNVINMNNCYSHITHESIPPFINGDSKILILGSLPSVKSRESGFFYGHKMNRFFPMLAKMFKEEVPITVEEKKELLMKHNIALYDVIYECDIIGSSDSSIKNVVPIDIKVILKDYPNINTIILNGNLAASLFIKYLLNDVSENIKIFYLPSTSPANAKMKLDDLVDAYKKAFINKTQ